MGTRSGKRNLAPVARMTADIFSKTHCLPHTVTPRRSGMFCRQLLPCQVPPLEVLGLIVAAPNTPAILGSGGTGVVSNPGPQWAAASNKSPTPWLCRNLLLSHVAVSFISNGAILAMRQQHVYNRYFDHQI